jgi:hypothetical protein
MEILAQERSPHPPITASAGTGKVEVKLTKQSTPLTSQSSEKTPTLASTSSTASTSADEDADTSLRERKRRSVKEHVTRRARETDGSRRHAEITKLLKEANEQQFKQAKEEGERLERMMHDAVQTLTGGSQIRQEIDTLKKHVNNLEKGVDQILKLLQKGKGNGKEKRKRQSDDEEEQSEEELT